MYNVNRSGNYNKNRSNNPIIMKDGQIIDPEKTIIDNSVIEEGMRYVSKMSIGLATGVLANDEEYISFQKEIISNLIKKQASKTHVDIENKSKQKQSTYENSRQVHEDALKRMRGQVDEVTKDNILTFYEEDDGFIKTVHSVSGITPVGLSSGSPVGKDWEKINIEELKSLNDERMRIAKEKNMKKDTPESSKKTKKTKKVIKRNDRK